MGVSTPSCSGRNSIKATSGVPHVGHGGILTRPRTIRHPGSILRSALANSASVNSGSVARSRKPKAGPFPSSTAARARLRGNLVQVAAGDEPALVVRVFEDAAPWA
jgi:hypothetical protein